MKSMWQEQGADPSMQTLSQRMTASHSISQLERAPFVLGRGTTNIPRPAPHAWQVQGKTTSVGPSLPTHSDGMDGRARGGDGMVRRGWIRTSLPGNTFLPEK